MGTFIEQAAYKQGREQAEGLIQHLIADGAVPTTFESGADKGNQYVSAFNEGFMRVYIPWMAAQIASKN